MKMISLVLLVIGVFFTQNCFGHTYSPGSCPSVEPIPDFDMTKFLGQWYAIEKTTTKSSCLIYNFKEGKKCGEYLLAQTSERYPTRLSISYVFDYTGKITANNNSSQMTIKFPLNVAGSASFDVVTTDYNTYAVIYTCQNVLFFKRQSATFLSRTNSLDADVLKKIKHFCDEQLNLSDLKLDTIRHDNCNEASSQILLSVKSNLASSINFSRGVPALSNAVTNSDKESDRRSSDDSFIVEQVEPVERVDPIESVEQGIDTENFIEPRHTLDSDQVVKEEIK